MLYIALFFYVLIFWTTAWYRPAIALMLIFASAPFQHDISGGGSAKFSIAELNMLLILPIFLIRNFERKVPLLGPLLLPIILYFAVSLFSTALQWHGGNSLNSLIQMFLYLVAAVLVFSSFLEKKEDLRISLIGLTGVGLLLATE